MDSRIAPSSRSGYIPELDGLRGIAALGVVALHWSSTYTFWMWSCVDLFFVLSGFLITRILLQSYFKQRLSLKNFWIARILRIWPVYYVTLIALCVYYAWAEGTQYFSGTHLRDVLLSFGFLQFTPLYADIGGDPKAMFDFWPGFMHSWSLAVEEQFYLLWPLALIALLKRGKLRSMALICVALVCAAPFMRHVGMSPTLLFARLDGLALGALIAVIQVANQTQPQMMMRAETQRILYAVAAVLGLLLTVPYLSKGYLEGVTAAEQVINPLLISGFSLLYFSLVGTIVSAPPRPLLGWLGVRPLVYLGSISYAVYMFHFPILGFVKPRIAEFLGPQWRYLSHLIVWSLIIGLPHLSRIWMERPLLAFKDRLLSVTRSQLFS